MKSFWLGDKHRCTVNFMSLRNMSTRQKFEGTVMEPGCKASINELVAVSKFGTALSCLSIAQ